MQSGNVFFLTCVYCKVVDITQTWGKRCLKTKRALSKLRITGGLNRRKFEAKREMLKVLKCNINAGATYANMMYVLIKKKKTVCMNQSIHFCSCFIGIHSSKPLLAWVLLYFSKTNLRANFMEWKSSTRWTVVYWSTVSLPQLCVGSKESLPLWVVSFLGRGTRAWTKQLVSLTSHPAIV